MSTPSPTPKTGATAENPVPANDSSDKWLVKGPDGRVIKGEGFPDVTPSGTLMTQDEVKAAKEAAKQFWITLTASKVQKEASN